MNWKLIIQLSLFGLAMGLATVFVIPSTIEPLFWLLIFVVSAYFIATRCTGRYFWHGFLVSIVNSVWVTAVHFLFFDRYVANHPEEMAMMATMQVSVSPRTLMALMGPIFGVVSGVLLGIFSGLGRRIVEMREKSSSPDQ